MTLILLATLLACTDPPTLLDAEGLHEPSARAELGAPAPTFSLPSVAGDVLDLRELRGQVVVLEWFSTECPFVKQSHGDGALEEAPARWTARGVTWVAINSNAADKAGSDPGQTRRMAASYDLPVALIDANGAVGKAYGATVTPELFVLDAAGTLAYRGGPDNAPLGDVMAGGERRPWLDDALEAITTGQTPKLPQTKAWGCTIKY